MKKLLILLLPFITMALFPATVSASIATITMDGELEWKVLSSQDEIALTVPERENLSIKKLSAGIEGKPQSLELTNSDGKVMLKVEGKNGSKELDVSVLSPEIIEIEEQSPAESVIIGAQGNSFTITQKGIVASTDLPLTISPKDRTLALSTDSGMKYVAILPKEAVDSVVRPRIITHLPESRVTLNDDPVQGPTYQIIGKKVITPFNVFAYDIPVTASVSASTGEVLSVEMPTWFSLLGFLIS